MLRDIWASKCPPKLKHFLWRLAHNSLPHKLSIDHRLCPVCSRQDEDGAHIFLKCKFFKPLWRELQLEQTRVGLLHNQGPKDLVSKILALLEENKLECITMLWVWWDVRNKKNTREPMRIPVLSISGGAWLQCQGGKKQSIHVGGGAHKNTLS